MKRLALLRHAKSSWDNPGTSDFDRPLNKRGRHDAPRMGKLLAERGVSPTAIISSAAVRARTTAEAVGHELGFAAHEIQCTKALYLASANDMLKVLQQLAGDASEALLVGHNPGITSLANRIADARIDNLPTAACFYVEADVQSWAELLSLPGRLVFFASPKNDLT
jgi:phosphohistidine phosphatase